MNQPLMKTFGIVSKTIMTDTGLSIEARALYALLTCYCNAERVCFPSTATLARFMGKSEATVYRLLAELEKAGFIVKTRQGRKRIIIVKDTKRALTPLFPVPRASLNLPGQMPEKMQ